MTHPSRPNRKLKPFKRVIAERYKGFEVGRQIGQAINEVSEEMVITAASTVIIDDDNAAADRSTMIKGFATDIANMSGKRIIAIAVACDY